MSMGTRIRMRRFGGKVRPWHAVVVAVALAASLGGVVGSPTAEAATCKYPAQALDLTNWKLQLPVAKDADSIVEIKRPQLDTYTKDPYFVTKSKTCSDGVVFRAPVNGAHTSGSHYARTELREMTNNGKDNASWSSTVGTHTYTETIAFTALPKVKPDLVGAQIHNATEDISLLVLRGTNLYISDGDNSKAKLVTSSYKLGTKVDMKWTVSGGVTKAYINGALQLTINRAYDGAYFKAGAYPQASCDNSSPCKDSNYGSTTITKLAVSHTGLTTTLNRMLAPATDAIGADPVLPG
jgi:hypothetical protein